jgi:hypothetical protein
MTRSLSVLVCVAVAAAGACTKISTEASFDAHVDAVVDEPEAGPDLQPDINIDLPNPEDGSKFSSDSVGTSVDMNCGAMTHSAMKQPPDILIVQDRSLSMLNNKDDMTCTGAMGFDANCGTASKWYQVTTALNDVLSTTDMTVNWGLLYFGDETTTCGETATPVVPVASMNSSAISKAFVGQPDLTGQVGTPTRSAIINAVKYMKSLTDSNPKYLMLATDGQPNCAPAGSGGTSGSGGTNGAGGRAGSGGAGGRGGRAGTMTGGGFPVGGTNTGVNTDDSPGSEQAVADALTAGFPTFVIGIGNTGGAAVLNAMAVAGGKPVPGMPGGNSYYQVNNTADLEMALSQILGTVATCVFDIGPPPNSMTSVDQVAVFGDGTMIPHDGSNGWDFSNAAKTQVTLYGPICDQVKSATIKDVTVAFGCLGAL